VSRAVREQADQRGLRVIDATCPLVTKVHNKVKRYAHEERDVVLIGHRGHPEVEGTLGQFDTSFGAAIHLVQTEEDVAQIQIRDPEHAAFVTQTTLSMDDTARIVGALRRRFPKIRGPRQNDICYATQNRQDAVKHLAQHCDLLLVIGSRHSSNSNRLREIAAAAGIPAYLIDGPGDLRHEWLSGRQRVGVTAGASAPENVVQQVVAKLREWGEKTVTEFEGVHENVIFALPEELNGSGDLRPSH
jgi:4-hydroxy-3-methylbut-2-enyl diphosphate reductase